MKTFQLILMVGFVCVFAATSESAPGNNPKIPQLTRTVVIFSALEVEIIEALKNKNQTKLKSLLAEDFEMRQASEPSSPIPYTNWLANSLTEASKYTVDIEQMSVHDLSQTAIVNFLWVQTAENGQIPLAKVFVVDVWRQKGEQWQLAIRYISSTQDTNAKIPGFAPMPSETVIEKKF